jgi:protein gp37
MSIGSKIEWLTDENGKAGATWNPVVGCSKVSAGCENCYAVNMAARFSKNGQPFHGVVQTSEQVKIERYDAGLPQLTRTRPRWTGVTRFKLHKMDGPLRWRKPRRILVCSMGDLFHESVANEQIAAVFGVMAACPQHTFFVLTKRPKRAKEWFFWASNLVGRDAATNEAVVSPCDPIVLVEIAASQYCHIKTRQIGEHRTWPLPNAWLGVSAEDQATANERIPVLLQTPAAHRFVSCEPMLGPIDLNNRECLIDKTRFKLTIGNYLDWVIAGSETGPGARPCDLDWLRSLRDQCVDANVPFFLKKINARGDRKLDGQTWEMV